MSSGINILSGDFTVSGNNANNVYSTVITDNNLAEGKIGSLIEKRVNDVLFSGKSKANNGYNSILTYVAAESVLNVITHTAIKTSSSGSETPTKINASFDQLTASGATTLTGALNANGGITCDTDKFTVADTSGNTSIGGTLSVTGETTLSNNLTITGNLTVNGTTTTVNTSNTTINDNLLELNSGSDGVTNANDCGIIIERGDSGNNAIFYWDETNDEFVLGTTTATATSTGSISSTKGTLNIATLKLGDSAITSTAAELNILDGVTATAAELNILDGVTATTAELNILDGVTATTSELNILDGVTATATELNILDGVTATTADLNILDGVTATTAELNILDGVTATATELNILDGNTSATSRTVTDTDSVVFNDSGTMKQVAMSDIKTYTNTGITTYSTVDRSSATESGTHPTTLNNAFIDIYAKLKNINTYLVALDDNITVTDSSNSTVTYTTLDFDNTA